jgi:hypothetical protein
MFENEASGQVDGTDFIGGYGVPMDPMDLLQCDSCQ